MGNKSSLIPVYAISAFDSNNNSFWVGALENVLKAYPFLENPHIQSFYMLIYIRHAEGSVAVDGVRTFLNESKVICVNPNSVFSININKEASGIIVCFTENFFSLRYNDNTLQHFSFLKNNALECIHLSREQKMRWEMIVTLLKDEYHSEQPGVEKVLRSYLNILLYFIQKNAGKVKSSNRISSKEEKVVQFEKLLETTYKKEKKPSYYAQQLNITTNYLNKLCQVFRSKKAGDMVRARVIIEAQRLLHYTPMSVSEIAYALGFDSNSYFITFFKKGTGATPENFRKNNL